MAAGCALALWNGPWSALLRELVHCLTRTGPAQDPGGSSASEDFLCLHTVSFAGFPGEANPTGSANVSYKRH